MVSPRRWTPAQNEEDRTRFHDALSSEAFKVLCKPGALGDFI